MFLLLSFVSTAVFAADEEYSPFDFYFCPEENSCIEGGDSSNFFFSDDEISKEDLDIIAQKKKIKCRNAKYDTSEPAKFNLVKDGWKDDLGLDKEPSLPDLREKKTDKTFKMDVLKGATELNDDVTKKFFEKRKTLEKGGKKYYATRSCCPGTNSYAMKNRAQCDDFDHGWCKGLKGKACRQKAGCTIAKTEGKKKKECKTLPRSMCADFKSKKECKKAGKMAWKLGKLPPSDLNKGKCMWDADYVDDNEWTNPEGLKGICRPYIDLRCKSVPMDKCEAYGCKLTKGKKKGGKGARCGGGKRKPQGKIMHQPDWGKLYPCEISLECPQMGGMCACVASEKVWLDKREEGKKSVTGKACECMSPGRPYTNHSKAHASHLKLSNDWI